MSVALAASRAFADTLVGLTEREARDRADEQSAVEVHFLRPDQAVTLDLRSHRVRVVLEDGRVVQAFAG